jgi:flagellar biosynthetic protein FlhB
MALFGDDQGRTEKPTPGRLEEARNRGDSHLSRELLTAGTLLVAAVAMRWLGAWLFGGLGDALQYGLCVDLRRHAFGGGGIDGACREVAATATLVAAPVLALMALLAATTLLFGYGQIGLRWSTEALTLRLDRVDPAANWKRLFSPQSLVRTAFALVKLLVLGLVLWFVLRDRWAGLALLSDQDTATATREVADLVLTLLIWVAAVVFVLAVADVAWQRFDFQRRNMMTKQEVEDERRRSEGDPMIKSRQRQARLELMRHRMMEAVPKADVVITNPTHFSVALRYDRKRNAAPEVVAKGQDELALRIRELAREHGVPLLEDPPLARALWRAVKVGQEIPARFYEAVATVLSHVYRLKGRVA